MLRLLPLALATFGVGTDAFVIAGLLPAIARDLHVSVAAAGQLVTVFSLTFALTAPLLGALTSTLDRRLALALALGVFAVGNVVTALAASYAVALAGRIVTGVGAATITSTASSAAVAITPPEQRGRALSVVIGGLTVASVLGVPLGTAIGASDWHLALWVLAGIGVVGLLAVVTALPPIKLPATTLRTRLRPLTDPVILAMLAGAVLAYVGMYTLFTYVGAAVGGSSTRITLALLAIGVGVTTGNFLAGRLVDTRPAAQVLTRALAGTVVLSVASVWLFGTLPVVLVWGVAFGLFGGSFIVPLQHRMVSHDPDAAPVLLGLNSSAIYLGIAGGGAVGGLMQAWVAPGLLGLPAAVIVVLALGLTVVTRVREPDLAAAAVPGA